MDETSDTSQENQLIEEAYAATLDPTRLPAFERFWEAYIDAQLQNNPNGVDLDNTPVNAHIMIALDILSRLKIVQEEESLAQDMVNSHYGFGFIVENNGTIIAANDTAALFLKHETQLQNLAVDESSLKSMLLWLKKNRRHVEEQLKLFDVYLHNKTKNCWLAAPIKIGVTAKGSVKKHYLITAVDSAIDLKLDLHIIDYFKLTSAETDVTNLLCNGLKPEEVAQKRGVKISAVRTQIVRIKEKTGARDIPDIVRIVTTMAIRSKAVKSQLGRLEQLRQQRYGKVFESAREMSLTLGDGRNLQYFEQGGVDGVAILQIHSLISGVQFLPEHGKMLGPKYRMISPARPGYGKSDPKRISSLNSRIDSCVEDMRQLLDHLGVNKAYILTGWSGAIAQRFALKYPKRCLGLVLSGAVPVWESDYMASLQPRYRNMIKTSIHAPKAVPYLVRIAKALIDSGKAHLFISGLDAKDSIDKKALGNNVIYRLVEQRFKFLVEQGVNAFVDDLPLIHTDWTQEARRLSLPVTILIGSENRDQPHEAIERYKRFVTHANIKIIRGAGTYQNLTHFADVVAAIRAMST